MKKAKINPKNIFVSFALDQGDPWNQPENICQLSSRFFKGLFACTVGWFIVGMLAMSLLFLILVTGHYLWFMGGVSDFVSYIHMETKWNSMYTLFIGLGIMEIAIALVVLCAIGLDSLKWKIKDYRAVQGKVSRTRLFATWLRSKREKICIPIEYIKEGEPEEDVENAQILYSAMQTPDGTIIESTYRHDYVTHTDANGVEYMLDGGHDYIRSSGDGNEIYITYTMNDPHEIRRQYFKWGTWGKDGQGPYERKPLMDLTDEHIAAILETQPQIKGIYTEELLLAEQEYRKDNPSAPEQVKK